VREREREGERKREGRERERERERESEREKGQLHSDEEVCGVVFIVWRFRSNRGCPSSR